VAPKAKKGSVKLNISSLMAKHDEHKAEQRRAKEQRMKDDAASYHRRPAPSRRTAPRQGGGAQNKPHVRLAALLRDEVLAPLFKRPAPAGAFFKPVDKKQFPAYYVKIADPVDLATIKERLGRYVYRARSALLGDLARMAANAAAFNGPAHPIALEGKAMVDAAEAAAADHADELDALERETREQTALSSSRRPARKGKGPKVPVRAPVPPASTPPPPGRAPSPRDPPAAALGAAAPRAASPAPPRASAASPAPSAASPVPSAAAPAPLATPAPRAASPPPPAAPSPPGPARANSPPPLALMGGEDSSSGEEEEMDGGAV
jgi:hypothetical protein